MCAKYYISDQHYYNENAIDRHNRPFQSVTDMNESMILRHNAKVTNEDTVYFNGDFAQGSAKDVNKILKRLNGKKILIVGNNDLYLKDKDFKYKYLDGVYDYLEIKDNGRKVILFHYPIAIFNDCAKGAIHLYGHVHEKDVAIPIPNGYNISVEKIQYEPVTLDEILDLYTTELSEV